VRRRSFLRNAASILPSVAAPNLLIAQESAHVPATSSSKVLHIVGSGEDRFGKSHSLGFSKFFFKVSGAETGGQFFLMEHQHMEPGGPDLHLHLNQEEWFYVIEGEVAFQIGEQRLHLHAGESVLAPRRVPHTFSSVGPTPGRMLIGFCPAGKMEQYFLDAEDPTHPKRDPEFYEVQSIGPSPFWKTKS
jgi:mannose-6-phosphate isomerase-like protein (cupin superfamily)